MVGLVLPHLLMVQKLRQHLTMVISTPQRILVSPGQSEVLRVNVAGLVSLHPPTAPSLQLSVTSVFMFPPTQVLRGLGDRKTSQQIFSQVLPHRLMVLNWLRSHLSMTAATSMLPLTQGLHGHKQGLL